MRSKIKTIMLVDDDTSDNFFHRMIIEEMGICDRIIVAEDGEKALKILSNKEQSQPDLIFLDINMPKVNGWDFLNAYRKLSIEKNKTVILMLTTSENPSDKKRVLDEFSGEVRGYYNKPLTEAILNEVLDCYS